VLSEGSDVEVDPNFATYKYLVGPVGQPRTITARAKIHGEIAILSGAMYDKTYDDFKGLVDQAEPLVPADEREEGTAYVLHPTRFKPYVAPYTVREHKDRNFVTIVKYSLSGLGLPIVTLNDPPDTRPSDGRIGVIAVSTGEGPHPRLLKRYLKY
jgi:hypothetical protein